MIARLLALTAALLSLSPSQAGAQPAPQAAAPFDAAAAAEAVQTYLRRSGVPGALVVVTDGDRQVLRGGFGVDGRGEALGLQSRAPVCSVSKSFVALAVMQQVDAGRVRLDAPVASYLPEFRLDDPRFSKVTVRQLLAHRSGLSDRDFREKSVRPTPRSLEQAVAALRTARLSFDPGARRSYANPNYWVAARLVEVVSGQSFDAYMRQRVFLPLGMADTSTWNGVADAPDVAPGHLRVLGHAFAAPEPAWFLGGACGVVTTPLDMGRWLALQTTGRSETGQAIVSPSALDLMHQGLGWNRLQTADGVAYVHNGVMFTYSAYEALLPELGRGVGVAVMANAGVGLGPLPADELARLLTDLAAGRPARQPAPTAAVIDGVLAMLAAATTLLAGARMRRPLRARPAWRRAVEAGVCALPMLWFAFYPAVLRGLLGRDLDWRQSLYATPMLFVLVLALAVAGAAATGRHLSASRPSDGPEIP